MKQNQLWSLTGVPPEARETARAAAQKEGISIGDWLQRRILAENPRDHAPPELGGEQVPNSGNIPGRDGRIHRPRVERARPSARSDSDADLATRRIDEAVLGMARLLEANERSQSDATHAMGSLASEINAAVRDQANAFQGLSERIDRVERDTDTEALREAVRNLSQGLLRLSDQTAHNITDAAAQISSLTNNVDALGGKIVSAREESQRLGLFIQEQLSTFAERMRSAEACTARYPQVENTVETLSKRLAGLPQIEKSIAEFGRHNAEATVGINTLAGSLETLVSKISSAREESDRLAERLRSAEGRLASYPHVEDTVASLTKRIAGLSQIEQSVFELGKRDSVATGQINTLAGKLETLPGEIALAREESKRLELFIREQLSTFAEHMRSAEARVATYPQVEETVETLTTRIAALDQIEKTVANLGTRDTEASAQINALTGSLQTLGGETASAREESHNLIERMRSAESLIATYPQIEDTVAQLSKRIDGLGEIERTVADLGKREGESKRRIDAMANSFESFAIEISSAGEQSSQIAERLHSTEERLARFSQLEDTIEILSKHIARLDRIEKSVTELGNGDAEAARQINVLAGSLEAFASKSFAANELLAERVRSAEAYIARNSKVEDTVETLGKRIDGLDQIEKAIAELGRGDAEARRQIDSLAGSLKTVESKLASAWEESGQLAERLRSAEASVAASLQGEEVTANVLARIESLEHAAKDTGGWQLESLEERLESIAVRVEQNERNDSGTEVDVRQNMSRLEQLLDDSAKSNREVQTELSVALHAMASRLAAIEERGLVIPGTTQTGALPPSAPTLADDSDHGASPDLVSSGSDSLAFLQDTHVSEPPPYPPEVGLAPVDGSELPSWLQSSEATATGTPQTETGQDYLARARRAAITAMEASTSEDAAQKSSKWVRTIGIGHRKGGLLSRPVAGLALLLSLVAAGYFVMPRVTPQTAEIPRESNSAATISTPKPQANSTMDQELARANAGDAKAMLALGIAYADGTGVTRNDTEAAVWLERAAQAGEVIAQYRLGTRLERGIGVAADASQAVRWYTEAAQRGSAKAMYNLGISYAKGTGIEKNLTEAAHWFRSAAELGLTDSQFNLAVMYEHGLGVEVSLAEAYTWYAIAETGGDMESKTRAETLATQITAAQKGAADQVVSTFKPRLKNPEANEVLAPTGSGGP